MLAFQADFLRHSLPADAMHMLLYAPFAALGVAGTALRIVGWARKMHITTRRLLHLVWQARRCGIVGWTRKMHIALLGNKSFDLYRTIETFDLVRTVEVFDLSRTVKSPTYCSLARDNRYQILDLNSVRLYLRLRNSA